MVDLFSSLSPSTSGDEIAIVVGAALVAYLLGTRLLPTLPAVLPAFVAGVIAAALTGSLGPFPTSVSLPDIEIVSPALSWQAVLTVTPVLIALLTVQANVPSVVYLRTQGYDPPARALDVVSGAGTVAGSFLGPTAMSFAILATLVVAGPSAGDRAQRYRSLYLPLAAGVAIALLADLAADLAGFFPPALLLAFAGLALLPALTAGLREISAGPLVLGPLFAFAIALSDMALFGLGAFFWSLVIGTLVSAVFEREGWRRLADARGSRDDPDDA